MSPPGSRCRQTFELVRPREHGSWSLALEPLVLGLVAAPSAAGCGVAAAALAGLFMRRPLKLLLGGGDDSRRSLAWAGVAVLGSVALMGVVFAATLAGVGRLWPMLLAVPPGLAFAWHDSRGASRDAIAELAGVMAFAAIPAVLGSLAGWPPRAALALAMAMACRSFPTVLAIRAYLRRNKGDSVPAWPALAASTVAVLVVLLLSSWSLAPWMAVVAMTLLLMRAWFLLVPLSRRWPATTVGIAEAVLGGIVILMMALSWRR